MPISDARLVELYREREALKEEAAALLAQANKNTKKIIREMERRGTTGIEHDGQRITYVQAKPTVYDYDYILANLTPAQRKLIVTRVVDVGLLSRAIQEGSIDLEVVAAASSVKPSKPYIK